MVDRRAVIMAELQKSFAPSGLSPDMAAQGAEGIGAYVKIDADAAEARRNLQSRLWQNYYDQQRRRMRDQKRDFKRQTKYGVLEALAGMGGSIWGNYLNRPQVPGGGLPSGAMGGHDIHLPPAPQWGYGSAPTMNA